MCWPCHEGPSSVIRALVEAAMEPLSSGQGFQGSPHDLSKTARQAES